VCVITPSTPAVRVCVVPLASELSSTVDEVKGIASVVVTVFTSTFGAAVSAFDWLVEELLDDVGVVAGGETAPATIPYERRLATATVVTLPVIDSPRNHVFILFTTVSPLIYVALYGKFKEKIEIQLW